MKVCPVCGILNPDEFNFCQACPTQLGPAENIVAETKTKARWYALILVACALGIAGVGLSITTFGPSPNEPPSKLAPVVLSGDTASASSDDSAPATIATKPPTPKPEFVDISPSAAPKKVATKEEIANLWKGIVARTNPHLNYVDVKIQKSGKGFAIYATHDYFTRYTMSAGSDAKVCEEFIQLTRDELAAAKIVRVGFWGTGPYSSGCWLEVP